MINRNPYIGFYIFLGSKPSSPPQIPFSEPSGALFSWLGGVESDRAIIETQILNLFDEALQPPLSSFGGKRWLPRKHRKCFQCITAGQPYTLPTPYKVYLTPPEIRPYE